MYMFARASHLKKPYTYAISTQSKYILWMFYSAYNPYYNNISFLVRTYFAPNAAAPVIIF